MVAVERLFCDLIDAGEEDLFNSRSRLGIFSPALVMWLEISGRLRGRKSLQVSLDTLLSDGASEVIKRNKTSQVLRDGRISSNSGGLCRARQRLALPLVEKACELLSEELLEDSATEVLWNGRRVYLMDGTAISLVQSKENFAKYKPAKNQHGSYGTAQLTCTCLVDLFTGIALSPAFAPRIGEDAIGESRLGKAMLQRLSEPGVVVADRGFGVFSTVWTAQQNEHQSLVRLTSLRAKSILGKAPGKRDFDSRVVWKAMSTTLHPEIPSNAQVEGRMIQHTIRRKGFRPLVLTFFTTLSESAEELADLYQQRERIENDIRSLKYTLEMELLSSKSPEVLEKELLLGFAANNLVRAILARAAKDIGLEPRRLSFSRGLAYVRIFGNKLRDEHDDGAKKSIWQQLLTALNQTKLPNRPAQRLEPRKVVRKRGTFPLMKGTREEEREEAIEVAKENGHRGYFSTTTRSY
jgi:hypothetical protein